MLYFYILEGKIGRFEVEPEVQTEFQGFCTDHFTTCNILVLVSADQSRYVLIHADRSIKPEQVGSTTFVDDLCCYL